jgi:cysteine synthase
MKEKRHHQRSVNKCAKVRNPVLEATGNGPAVKLRRILTRQTAHVVVELAYYNHQDPTKRAGRWAMIEGAEAAGKLRPGWRGRVQLGTVAVDTGFNT